MVHQTQRVMNKSLYNGVRSMYTSAIQQMLLPSRPSIHLAAHQTSASFFIIITCHKKGSRAASQHKKLTKNRARAMEYKGLGFSRQSTKKKKTRDKYVLKTDVFYIDDHIQCVQCIMKSHHITSHDGFAGNLFNFSDNVFSKHELPQIGHHLQHVVDQSGTL